MRHLWCLDKKPTVLGLHAGPTKVTDTCISVSRSYIVQPMRRTNHHGWGILKNSRCKSHQWKMATTVTRRMTRTVGIAMAYFRGRKKSCTGCEVSTNGWEQSARVRQKKREKQERGESPTSFRQNEGHGMRADAVKVRANTRTRRVISVSQPATNNRAHEPGKAVPGESRACWLSSLSWQPRVLFRGQSSYLPEKKSVENVLFSLWAPAFPTRPELSLTVD